MNSRQTILTVAGVLVVVLIGVWWYFGFTLDFMRFFAAERGTDSGYGYGIPRRSPPPGCYYQVVQCIRAPCDPILVCPTCQPRPACLDATPPCMIAEPADGWCPPSGGKIVSCAPETQTVPVGSGAQLSAAGGSGANYQWFAPEGIIAMPDTLPGAAFVWDRLLVNYPTPGVKKVTIQAPRGDGTKNVDSVACTVIVIDSQ